MKILFAFENILPSPEADATVFMTTARHLVPLTSGSWMHVPASGDAGMQAAARLSAMPVLRAWAPVRPALLRHLCCGLTLVLRKQFREADLVYTRNLWVAWMALRFGQKVVFDHYRPWPDQIPPLQPWLRGLMCNPRFLVHICHSDYTAGKYRDLGVPADKLCRVWNGFDPEPLQPFLTIEAAKLKIGVAPTRKTVVYTGRVNHKKGLELVVEAAKTLPELLFILVGSYGDGPIEQAARGIANIRLVPWQPSGTLTDYVFAADVLLIPPSSRPLAEFGSTVLPLKLFFYMASGRPILAGSTPDVMELLRHGENAYLCRPDCPDALVAGLRTLTGSPDLAAVLAATALAESRDLTWHSRAARIADIVGQRLQAAPVPCDSRGRAGSRAWRRQSWRWLVHLVRKGSWILPPTSATPPHRTARRP